MDLCEIEASLIYTVKSLQLSHELSTSLLVWIALTIMQVINTVGLEPLRKETIYYSSHVFTSEKHVL